MLQIKGSSEKTGIRQETSKWQLLTSSLGKRKRYCFVYGILPGSQTTTLKMLLKY